jgi:hypothetical protein
MFNMDTELETDRTLLSLGKGSSLPSVTMVDNLLYFKANKIFGQDKDSNVGQKAGIGAVSKNRKPSHFDYL